MAQHNRHLGVAAAGAVKANFSACQRDVQLSRQRLRGVALIAGLVQNQKLIGVGSVFVENWTDTNCFSGIDGCLNSAFLYQSRPKDGADPASGVPPARTGLLRPFQVLSRSRGTRLRRGLRTRPEGAGQVSTGQRPVRLSAHQSAGTRPDQ